MKTNELSSRALALLDDDIYKSEMIRTLPKITRGRHFEVEQGGKRFFYFCDAIEHARNLLLKRNPARYAD